MNLDELKSVFEHSPWVAERAWLAGPFADLESLHAAMVQQVAQASIEEKLALIRAHPDLGTRAKMSASSVEEQAGAGLDRLTAEEFQRLHRLNGAYRDKFGFPFLLAVKNSTKHDILRSLEDRLMNSPDREFDEALRQIYRIAWFRLQSIAG